MVVVKISPRDEIFRKDAVETPTGFMRRFVVGENDMFRAGFALNFKKKADDKEKKSSQVPLKPMWVDEFIIGIKGIGRITCRSPPDYDGKETHVIEPGDTIFMGRGTLRKIKCISDKPWVFFYCAIPASSKFMAHKILPPLDHNKDKIRPAKGSCKS